MKNSALVFLTFLSVHSFCQDYSANWADLNYADDDMSYHLLDIYLPKFEKSAYPVVILIYGSAWFSNDLTGSDMNTIGSAFLKAGYAVVTPNHRSSADAKFPAQINDIKAAVRFLRANCNKYQLDTTFIGITGSSSGGHLAALMVSTNFVKKHTADTITMDIEGNMGEHTSFSSKVDAVCDWFGPTDLLVMDSCGSTMSHNAENSPESSLIGGAIQENKSKCALANPISYVDPTDPPYLFLHGDSDPLVPYCNSELLYEALQDANVQSEFILVPEGDHYTGVHTDANIGSMLSLFNELLNNETSSANVDR